MAQRTFRLVRVGYPLAAECEACGKNFVSRADDPAQAEKEIRAAFEAHKCKREDLSLDTAQGAKKADSI
jgi:hypothetical protein